jgi:hypothetical protein
MSDHEPVADQIRHYRALAQIANDCAHSSQTRAAEYSKLSRQWLEVADRLERSAGLRSKT